MRQRINYVTPEVAVRAVQSGDWVDYGFGAGFPELLDKERLAYGFREFVPYLGQCRFVGCAHVKEKGCAIRAAVKEGKIQKGRHDSYVRLYAVAKEFKAWEKKPSRPIK